MSITLTIRLDDKLDRALTRFARRTGRPESEFARDALRRQLAVARFEEARRIVAAVCRGARPAHRRGRVRRGGEKVDEKLPSAKERAQNREKVSKGASNKGKVDSGEAKKKAGETRRRSTA